MLLREAWFTAKHKGHRDIEAVDTGIWLENCKILNTVAGVYEDELKDVLVSNCRIQTIRTAIRSIADANFRRINCDGKVLMPGR